jgi:hypothetical protein
MVFKPESEDNPGLTGRVGWPGLPEQLIFLFYKYVKMTLFWTKFYKKKINRF